MASTMESRLTSENVRDGVDTRNKDLTDACIEKQELASNVEEECEDCGENIEYPIECDGYKRCPFCHDYYIQSKFDFAYISEQYDDFVLEESDDEEDWDNFFDDELEMMRIDGTFALMTGGLSS